MYLKKILDRSGTYLKKILDKSGTHINKGIKVVLYQNGAVRYLNSKSELIPIISICF